MIGSIYVIILSNSLRLLRLCSLKSIPTLLLLPAKIVTDRVSGKSKGFGFVTYACEDEAEKAITQMDGRVQHSFPFLFLLWYLNDFRNNKVIIDRL